MPLTPANTVMLASPNLATAPLARRAAGHGRLTLIRVAFVLFVFTLPFEAVNLGQWSRIETLEGESSFISLPKFFGYLFFLATLVDWRRCYARMPQALGCFGAYFVLYAAQGVMGSYAGEALSRVASRAQMLVLVYAGANLLADPRTRTAVLTAFGSACALLAALASSGAFNAGMVQSAGAGSLERVTGLAEDANTVAAILSLGLLSVVWLCLSWRRLPWWARGLGWAAALGLVYAIVRTGSRGGMLALGGGLLVFAAGERSPSKWARNLAVVAAIGACTALCLLNWDSALQRWQATLYDGNTAGRDVIFEQTWKLIQEKPLLGWGAVTADRVLGAALGLPTRGTHNLWLSVLLENGVVGALPYAVGIGLCLAAAWQARRGEAGVLPLALLTVVLVANLSVVWHNQKAHWLVLALALASGLRTRPGMPLCPTTTAHASSSPLLLTPYPAQEGKPHGH